MLKARETRPAGHYRRGRSSVTSLHVHLVFVVKYRRRVLSDRCFHVIRATAATTGLQFGAELQELDGEPDHVHLLVEYPPTCAIAPLVGALKGSTAHHLRDLRFPEIESMLWGAHLWSPSYFAASCGGAPLDVIAAYVREQRSETTKAPRLSRP